MNTVSQSLVVFYFSSNMVFITLYIERRNKGGEFFYKYPNLAPRRLFKSGAY